MKHTELELKKLFKRNKSDGDLALLHATQCHALAKQVAETATALQGVFKQKASEELYRKAMLASALKLMTAKKDANNRLGAFMNKLVSAKAQLEIITAFQKDLDEISILN